MKEKIINISYYLLLKYTKMNETQQEIRKILAVIEK